MDTRVAPAALTCAQKRMLGDGLARECGSITLKGYGVSNPRGLAHVGNVE
jgi:hypothetical protein